MKITVRNITKDTMTDFDNDYTINLPMNENEMSKFLGNDEWIIVDAPVGEEFTNIAELNALLNEMDEEELLILSQSYLISEIIEAHEEEISFTILNFNETTSKYQGGNGVPDTDEWKGYVLFHEGYAELPFTYQKEMEDYIRWEAVWTTANCNRWREVRYNDTTYLICK